MALADPTLVYIPNPGTYSINQQVKAPLLRADVAGAVQLLANPPIFSAINAVTPTSVVPTTDVPVTLDNENTDPYNGHRVTGPNNAKYYGMLPGWYLCESTVPYNDTGGTGQCNAGIGFSGSGSAVTAYYGQRMGISSTGGQFSMPVCAKMIQMVNTGTLAGTANDYVVALARQSSGGTNSVLSNANKSAGLQLEWVSANTGTPGLIVPANDSWPAPPAIVTSAFVNKNIRDTIDFLAYPPLLEAYLSGAAAGIASQTSFPVVGQPIPLDATFADTWAAFSTGTGIWTCPRSGLYYVCGFAGLTGDSTSVSLAAGVTVTSPLYNSGSPVTIWGGAQTATASAGNAAVVRKRIRFLQGDTAQLAAFQRDSSSLPAAVNNTLLAQAPCRLIVIWRAA